VHNPEGNLVGIIARFLLGRLPFGVDLAFFGWLQCAITRNPAQEIKILN
jgi:hypothetical protein